VAVPSAEFDVRQLAAHVLGVSHNEVGLIREISGDQSREIAMLVRRRATREPIQHIVGTAPFMDFELAVGPGVFVPRPETESLADFAISSLREVEAPVVVELFAGSGAIAFAVATHIPNSTVIALEKSGAALAYANTNLTRLADKVAATESTIEFRDGDATATTQVLDLLGRADAVLANPPYIPEKAIPRDPEVRLFDPPEALFGGSDGYAFIRPLVAVAAQLLRPGGLVAIEHGDMQGGPQGVPGIVGDYHFNDKQWFEEVMDRTDLGGRPRFTTARRGR